MLAAGVQDEALDSVPAQSRRNFFVFPARSRRPSRSPSRADDPAVDLRQLRGRSAMSSITT
jgi:hypothetical protein